MRSKQRVGLAAAGVFAIFAIFAILGVWAVHRELRLQACPWIRTGIPKVTTRGGGLEIQGIDRVTNYGDAPVVKGKWASYLLVVPRDDSDKDVGARIKLMDQHIPEVNPVTVAPGQDALIPFIAEVSKGPLPASFSAGPITGFAQADRYLRLLFTYDDKSGVVHHTNSCYQLEEEPDGAVSVFCCPFANVRD